MVKFLRYILFPLLLFLTLSVYMERYVQKLPRVQSFQSEPHHVENRQNICDKFRICFIRHIDTLFNDTLYSVCHIGSDGETIRARLPMLYENPDTTIWTYFYLRNNGDTILYENNPEANNTETGFQGKNQCIDKSINDSITPEEQDVINEIQQYLTDYNEIEK